MRASEELIIKNELAHDVKILLTEENTQGEKGKKRVPHKYSGVRMQVNSMNLAVNVMMTKKELYALSQAIRKFVKKAGKKSELTEI